MASGQIKPSASGGGGAVSGMAGSGAAGAGGAAASVDASTAEAVRFLQRAAELAPHLPAHRVELGFALLANRQRDAAKLAFEQALTMPQREKYDEEARQRARSTLEKIR